MDEGGLGTGLTALGCQVSCWRRSKKMLAGLRVLDALGCPGIPLAKAI